MRKVSLLTQQAICLLVCCLGAQAYLYADDEGWQRYQYCQGCGQSPINILTNRTTLVKFANLIFENFDKPTSIKIVNTGDLIVGTVRSSLNATVTGANLYDKYKATTLHFHWGSEHLVNGRRRNLEVQIHNYNTLYADDEVASLGMEGYVNIAIQYVNGTERQAPRTINRFCRAIKHLKFPGDIVILNDVTLDSFFKGLNRLNFFLYCGSQTIPPCWPNVIWIVFKSILFVPRSCLETLSSLLGHGLIQMYTNRRQAIEMGDRRVFTNIP